MKNESETLGGLSCCIGGDVLHLQSSVHKHIVSERDSDNGVISPVIQSRNQSRVPSSRPRTDVRPEGKDARSNAEHKVERK